MKLPVTKAKTRLAEFVRRAEAGEEIILTRYGHPAVRLIPIRSRPTTEERRDLIARLQRSVAAKRFSGPDAAGSQDFLYDCDGLPV